MMKYEIFKEVVADTFKDYLPEQYRSMDLRVESVNKVNRMLDGITLVSAGADKNISPTVYINDMYDHYKLCNDLKEAIRSGADRMVKAFSICPEMPKIELSEAKDNIVFQLVNTEQNREMLAGIPHREFQDLAVIYRWVVKVDADGIQSTMVRNSLAEQLGLNEEQLFKLAVENTRRIFPPVVKSMNDVIREMFVLLSREDFLVEKKKYDEETTRLEQRLQELQSRQEIQQESNQQIEKNISQLNCYVDQMELTEEIKEKLIDKVNVYSDNRIEICWNFDSGFFDLETMHKCG